MLQDCDRTSHMPQFCKIMLSYFDFIPRHYVKFNAKLKLITQQSQNMWNVILNILFLINKKWRQQLGRDVNKSVTGQTGARN